MRTVPRDVVTTDHVSTLAPGQSAYDNDGCRCHGCKDGKADYQAEARRAYRERPDLYPFKHGTVGGYANHGCRCTECRLAQSEARRCRRAKRAAS